jgi:Bacteriophage holin of superfamily 6 (Holin_LLH)
MKFVIDNSELLLNIVLIVLSVIIGYWLIPLLKNKKKISEEQLKNIEAMIQFSQLFMKSLNVSKKEKMDIIFELSMKTVEYVEQVMKFENNDNKKKNAVELVRDSLEYLGYEVSEEDLKMIELGIESAVNLLPKTYKK